jgi:hypothetical protein
MTGAVREEDVVAAVEAFVSGEAARAPEHQDALARWVRDNIGRYLKKAKQHGDEARARAAKHAHPSHAPMPEGATVALDVFAEAWSNSKGRDFVRTPADERKALDLVAPAREHSKKLRVQGREIIRHWAKGYLADEDPFVAGKDHPFALFVGRIGQYGLPGPESSKPARAPQEPPAPRAFRRSTPEEQDALMAARMEMENNG